MASRPGLPTWGALAVPCAAGPGPWGRGERHGDVADLAPFGHDETEDVDAVFQHYAYATEGQLRHKKSYYGQAGALDQWLRLQAALDRSCRLRDFFSWVQDDVLA